MQEFLRLYRLLPVELLFLEGERFDDEGYRWAPKSFIRRSTAETSFLLPKSPMGEFLTIEGDHVERTGLYCNQSGFLIYFPRGEPVNDIFFFYCRITKRWYTVGDPQDGETAAERRGIDSLERPAILAKSTLGIGAVVNITREAADGRYFAKYIARTVIQRQTPEFTNKIGPVMEAPEQYRPKKIDDLKHVILRGKKCGDEQKWCIY